MELPINYDNSHSTKRKKAREEYVKLQKGLCCHCGNPLNSKPPKSITSKKINWSFFPPNFRKYPVHLHHDHNTGMTIGAIHNYCNAYLWQYHGE
jgi:hypothetical protein